jgi:hypothetical protein
MAQGMRQLLSWHPAHADVVAVACADWPAADGQAADPARADTSGVRVQKGSLVASCRTEGVEAGQHPVQCRVDSHCCRTLQSLQVSPAQAFNRDHSANNQDENPLAKRILRSDRGETSVSKRDKTPLERATLARPEMLSPPRWSLVPG